MLDSLTKVDRAVIYEAILYAIRHDFRAGFHNCDPGHPAYSLGKDGTVIYADGPDSNALFKLMHEFSRAELESDDPSIHEPVLCWADFCRIVSVAYEKNRKSGA